MVKIATSCPKCSFRRSVMAITGVFAVISAVMFFLGDRDLTFIMTFLANLIIGLHQESMMAIEKNEHECTDA